jgi:predicted Zn-dependent peptidase
MKPKTITLANGLPVLLLPMESVESLTSMVLTNTGSRYEQAKQFGIAHFFEHIVFKGTKNYESAQKLAATIDGLGAEFNAFTSNEYTGYYVKAAAKHTETALDVLSDMLLTPLLRESDIEREKGVIIEEMNMYSDTPARKIGMLFNQMVFKDTGLGHDILGTKETVSQITKADFEAFLRQWYGLSNMVLVLAGKDSVVNDKKLHQKIEKLFSKKTEDRVNEKIDIETELFDGDLSEDRLHLEYKKTQQAHFVLGWKGLKRKDKDRYALAVASTILGANMSSRLFSEIREKRGLSYYVRSEVDQYHDTGIFGAAAGVDPERVEEAISVALQEFHSMTNGEKPVTKEELKRAKEHLVGSTILSMEDSSAVAQFYGLKKVLSGEIETLDKVLEKIQAIGKADIERVLARIVKKGEVRLALIGPYKNKTKFEKLIKDL